MWLQQFFTSRFAAQDCCSVMRISDLSGFRSSFG